MKNFDKTTCFLVFAMVTVITFYIIICHNKIPKVIHRVYIDFTMHIPKILSNEIQVAHNTWKTLNPGYRIKYYSGHDCEQYLLKHFGERHLDAFKKVNAFAYKCDLFRYCLLYNEGGIYTDWKTVCIKPIKSLLKRDTIWASGWDHSGPEVQPYMWNGFICSQPKSPILRTAIDMCLYNIENNVYGTTCLEPTGPKLLGKAFLKHYPQYGGRHSELIDENSIIIGRGVRLPSLSQAKAPKHLYFNPDFHVLIKCETCGQTQYWKNGNSYNTMWNNKEIYGA
jgi:mannosyltransferase OCH1-like enzyme